MKIYAVIAGLFAAFTSLAADVNITNVTRAAEVPSGSYALGTTGLVTRLLPINLMSVATATTLDDQDVLHNSQFGLPYDPSKTMLVALGDSITANTSSWFNRLTNNLGWSCAFCTNAAISGAYLNHGDAIDETNIWSSVIKPIVPASNSGTNMIIFSWIGANDYINLGNLAAATNWVNTYSNTLDNMVSSNCIVVVFTVMNRSGGDTADYRKNRKFINDSIKTWPNQWIHVVDADALFPDCYNLNDFSDGTHLTASASTNTIVNAHWRLAKVVDHELRSARFAGPFSEKHREGTNYWWYDSAYNPVMAISNNSLWSSGTVEAATLRGTLSSVFLSGAVQQTIYTNDSTTTPATNYWVMPTNCYSIHVVCIGGGGGGGSASVSSNNGAMFGGGGGAPGCRTEAWLPASLITNAGSTVACRVGNGGAGGTGVTVGVTPGSGNNGGDGASSYFGGATIVAASAGQHGNAGTASAGAGGYMQEQAGGSDAYISTQAGSSSVTASAGAGNSPPVPGFASGGGAGGGWKSDGTGLAGGASGISVCPYAVVRPGGGALGAAGTNGPARNCLLPYGGCGGSGSGGNATGSSGNGGNGAFPGGGGGGSGVATNAVGSVTGNGGNGGGGMVWIEAFITQ